jgi:antitoxin HicB
MMLALPIKMKFRFRYKIEPDGHFFARCLDFSICSAAGANLEELKANAERALHDDLTVPPNTCIYLTPRTAANPLERNVFSVIVRPGAAFALSLRELRTQRVLFQRQVARKLGMHLSAYQRLEDPLRANPTLETIARVREIFPKLDVPGLFESDHL